MFLFLFLFLLLLRSPSRPSGQAGASNFPNEPAPNAVFGAAQPPWRTVRHLHDGDGQWLSRSYDNVSSLIAVQGHLLSFFFSSFFFFQDTSLHGAGH
jgi:hypothetical protein